MNTATVIAILGALSPVLVALFGYLGSRHNGTTITQTADGVQGPVTQRVGNDVTVTTTVNNQHVTVREHPSGSDGKGGDDGWIIPVVAVLAVVVVAAAVQWWDTVVLVLGIIAVIAACAVAFHWGAHLRADRLMTAHAVIAVVASLAVLWALWEIPRGVGVIPSFADLPREDSLLDTASRLELPVVAAYVARLGGLVLLLVVASQSAMAVVSRGVLVREVQRSRPRAWVLTAAARVSALFSGGASWIAGLTVVLLLAVAMIHPGTGGLLVEQMTEPAVPGAAGV